MNGDPLPEDDHVSRYCKPTSVDRQGLPMAAAFRLRQGEEYLSVNWVEYLGAPDLPAAVERIRDVFRRKNYALRANGRFALLQVGDAKTAVHEGVGYALRFDHLPLDNDQSHTGVFGYTADDLAVAAGACGARRTPGCTPCRGSLIRL